MNNELGFIIMFTTMVVVLVYIVVKTWPRPAPGRGPAMFDVDPRLRDLPPGRVMNAADRAMRKAHEEAARRFEERAGVRQFLDRIREQTAEAIRKAQAELDAQKGCAHPGDLIAFYDITIKCDSVRCPSCGRTWRAVCERTYRAEREKK